MSVKQVTPVLFASEIDDVIYGCDKCGTEVKRTAPSSGPDAHLICRLSFFTTDA